MLDSASHQFGSPHPLFRFGAVFLLLCGVAMPVQLSAAEVSVYVEAAAATLPPQPRDALRSINAEGAQLLALRGYLRADTTLTARWSWTRQQIADYERSDNYQQLLAAIADVDRRFKADNPGYSLFANTQVRSLDLQLERWNSNPGVARAAQLMHESVQEELVRRHYPQAPDAQSTQRFVAFLRALPPRAPVPLAVPGLSLHGQLRAVDFQIRQGSQTIAGPVVATVATVWERGGWADKLAHAVDTTRGVFAGPLKSPDEPWHYEYLE